MSGGAPPPTQRPVIPGHSVEILASVPSTNTEAKRRVEAGEAGPGLVLVTDEQTAGRGRRGHTWITVPGRSLAITAVVAARDDERPAHLTTLAAAAACRALEDLGVVDVSIKWPNDLLRDGRKIGGLLTEVARLPSGPECLVVGLGVNLALQPGDLPPELATRAGDAGLPTDRRTCNALISGFVGYLDAARDGRGSAEGWGQEYRRRSMIAGRRVELLWSGRREQVTVADVTESGDLVLADGRVAPGEVIQLVSIDAGSR